MQTVHEDAVVRGVQKLTDRDPSAWKVLHDYAKGMNTGQYDAWLLDFLMSEHHRRPYDIYDAFCFMRLWAAWHQGLIAFVSINVEAKPMSDEDVEENQALLTDLPGPFSAVVSSARGRSADSDGLLKWNEPIVLDRIVSESHVASCPTDCSPHTERWIMKPAQAPLEIGSTKASRTILHLAEEGALARWPYGDQKIRLCIVTDLEKFRGSSRNAAGLRYASA
jgi:hypothetical protein